MPFVLPSWRKDKPRLGWLSRALCFFGIHHWMRSWTTKKNLVCVVCEKKTKHWDEYGRLVKERQARKNDGA